MWKYFTAKNTRVYIDILQDILQGYNNSYHRSIGQAPASVSLLDVGQVRRKLYGNSWAKPIRELKFKLGDQIRIQVKSHFQEGLSSLVDSRNFHCDQDYSKSSTNVSVTRLC